MGERNLSSNDNNYGLEGEKIGSGNKASECHEFGKKKEVGNKCLSCVHGLDALMNIRSILMTSIDLSKIAIKTLF